MSPHPNDIFSGVTLQDYLMAPRFDAIRDGQTEEAAISLDVVMSRLGMKEGSRYWSNRDTADGWILFTALEVSYEDRTTNPSCGALSAMAFLKLFDRSHLLDRGRAPSILTMECIPGEGV
jgi:hypothetical protein